MKKIVSALICVLLVITLFAGCGAPKAWKENINEEFNDLPTYNSGEVNSATFGTSCNVKISDNDYKHFTNYINKLKKDGFVHCPIAGSPENFSLNNGSASWRCTNGKLFLQLIFNEDTSATFGMFNCNVQIYGYSSQPNGWELPEELKQKEEETSEEATKKSDNKKESDKKAETDDAEKATKKAK